VDEFILCLNSKFSFQRINLPDRILTYESRCFNLGNLQVLAISYWIGSPRNGGATCFFTRSEVNNEFNTNAVLEIYTEHVRNLIFVDTAWGPGIMMSDHGLDVPPYEGGKLHLVVNCNSILINKSDQLPRDREFYFDLCAFKESKSKYDSVIVTALDNGRKRPKYLKFTNSGVEDLSANLPSEWLNQDKHFMSVCNLSCDDQADIKIALGKVDFIPARGKQNEVIVNSESGGWNYSKDINFSPIKKNAEWGTVKMKLGKISEKDKSPYLVCLNHDFGFKNSVIQIYEYNSKKLDEIDFTINHPEFLIGSFYMHDAIFCDIDGDGENEFLITCRENKNWDFEKWTTDLLVLKRDPSGEWKLRSLKFSDHRLSRVESISLLKTHPLHVLIRPYGDGIYELKGNME
jgi:hypothetical protein